MYVHNNVQIIKCHKSADFRRSRYTLLVSATDQADRASERLTSLARVEIAVDENQSEIPLDYDEDPNEESVFAITVGKTKNVPKRSTPPPPGSGVIFVIF